MSFSLSGAISGAISGAFVGFLKGGFYGAIVGAAAGFVVGGLAVGDMERKARNRARDAWNNAQKDRQLTIQSATAPQRIIYGRDRVGGVLVYAQTTGAKSEYLHLVIALAGHECDAIETVYFGDTALVLDGAGMVTNPEFSVTRNDTVEQTFTTSGTTLALGHTPTRVIGVVLREFKEIYLEASRWDYVDSPVAYSVSGSTVTLAASNPDATYAVNYEYQVIASPLVRVRKYLGTSTQTADADLVAESGGKWTAAHRLRGIAYLYVRLQYDQDVFGASGRPDVLALVRGRKVYDPRSAQTVWSENSALCAADYLRSYMGATAPEVPDAELIGEANLCDQPVQIDIVGATHKRYTTNGSFSTESAPRENMAALLEAMAGSCVWAQGRYLLRAGSHRASAMTITEDMLAEGPVTIQQGTQRSELVNRVVPLYQEPARGYVKVEAPAVTNASYVADDGGLDLPFEVHYDMCSDSVRAQRLAKIALEQARAGMRVQLECNLRAYDLTPGSTVALTLARYGWAGKLFTVTERAHDFAKQTVALALAETAAGVWDWNFGEATTVDMTPNTSLRSPWERPPALGGLAVASGTPYLLRTRDGTVQCRALVTWTQSPDINVVQGGQVLVRWRQSDGEWTDGGYVAGNATKTLIGPLKEGVALTIGLLAVTQLDRQAVQWSYVQHIPVGESQAPANVSGMVYSTKAQSVVIGWNANSEADYAFTELRLGATWAEGTPLVAPGPTRVSGSSFVWPRPANGSYTVRARHCDTSGNYSVADATLDLTVSNAIDGSSAVGTAQVYLYQFSAVQPGNPSGTSTFTWASAAHAAYTGGNSWQTTVPANPGTPGVSLWVALKSITAPAGTAASTVDWSAGYTVRAWSTNSAQGPAGVQSAAPTVYRWDVSIPAGPAGTPTYDWATGGFGAAPAGWQLTPGSSPSAGYTLWGATVQLVDAATAATTNFNWSSATITARGYAGTQGPQGSQGPAGAAGATGATGSAGPQGASYRAAYAKSTSGTLGSGSVQTSGSGSFPAANAWGGGETWGASMPALAAGEYGFVSDGIFDAATNITTWSTPYQAALKVGSLAAITTNTGSLSVTGDMAMSGGSAIKAGSWAYGFSWADPATNGFYLNNIGLLMGSSAGNKIQLNADGYMYVGGKFVHQQIGGVWRAIFSGELSAVSGTFGAVDVSTGGKLTSGKTSYGSGTGFLLEYNAGTPRMDIGGATQYMRWDGSALLVGGDIIGSGNLKAGAVTDGALGLTTFSASASPSSITYSGSSSSTDIGLGGITVTPSNGKSPYSYAWTFSVLGYLSANNNLRMSSTSSSTAYFSARGTNFAATGFAVCVVTDANGRTTTVNASVDVTLGTPP